LLFEFFVIPLPVFAHVNTPPLLSLSVRPLTGVHFLF